MLPADSSDCQLQERIKVHNNVTYNGDRRRKREVTVLLYHGLSDVGKRRAKNQDSYTVKQYKCGAVLGVVCDGMGGALGGETASATALKVYTETVDALMEGVTKTGKRPGEWKIAEVLLDAVCKANAAVYSKSEEDAGLKGMGTTLVSSLILDNRIYTVNVGDSRMYLVDSDKIVQVTHDHSYVQYLVDIGKMTSEEAASSNNKNIITRAVGTEEEIEPDIYLTEIKKGAAGKIHILLCTDGLTNHVSKEKICEIVNSRSGQSENDAEEATVRSLIDTANKNGGSDNITAVLISV